MHFIVISFSDILGLTLRTPHLFVGQMWQGIGCKNPIVGKYFAESSINAYLQSWVQILTCFDKRKV